MMRYRVCLLVLGSLAFAGCSSAPPAEVAAGCNPLVGDDCLSPFPSSLVETADPSTPTGYRLNITDSALPKPSGSPPLMATRLNLRDGVSPASPFLVYFKAGVEPTQLPDVNALEETVTPTSPVQVIDFSTGERVPVLAELDTNASGSDRQALIIHPLTRLKPATRYVIALVGLRDAKGKPLAPAGFTALRDHGPLSKSLLPLVARWEEIFGALAGRAGLARQSVTLAWDVITASDTSITSHLVSMRDTALPQVPSLTWSITSMTDFPRCGASCATGQDQHRLREIVGTFQAPLFLKGNGTADSMNLDASGKPAQNGLGTASFVVDIPQCASNPANLPLPVMVFGHGLFGNAKDELASDYQKQVGDFLCMVQIGTDWIGLSSTDPATLATKVLTDLNHVNILTDRLQQGHLNAQVLTRLFLTRMKSDPALMVGGRAVTDGSQAYYYGISNGGIQGAGFMALSQDITRGVLNVPGAEWTLMMFRSGDFNGLKPLLNGTVPDPFDQQVGLVLMQPELDYTDPATFAPHLVRDPIGGGAVKRILVQESLNDAQVPNVATRLLARTIGLSGLDLVQPVFGITTMPAPLDSAYTQWDVTPMPVPPDGNRSLPQDNQAHSGIRRLIPLENQLKAFFTPNGQVTSTCGGSCKCDIVAGTCSLAVPL